MITTLYHNLPHYPTLWQQKNPPFLPRDNLASQLEYQDYLHIAFPTYIMTNIFPVTSEKNFLVSGKIYTSSCYL